MRFIVDECLPIRLTHALIDGGHDAIHVVGCGLGGAPDTKVMEHAAAENRVLVSADTDFGELLAIASVIAPSVIIFRRAARRAEELASVLLANLDEIADDLHSGALVVIGEERIRIRRLPV
jgi:predicted nuclease of predicted toxin-antitoxin system